MRHITPRKEEQTIVRLYIDNINRTARYALICPLLAFVVFYLLLIAWLSKF